ncbi:hypothetical protein CLV24_111115 [Pontibacter ummariensis]|uniref:Outer membrane protein beta-barrel domain-containing protein n=1 Tax=Pontibacter ummariensis TaxID=1610492 RepID=A0A239GLH0_9BACT|nr:hypothetical protein [Pontibacter ummariensis]PRY11320.1 hypothetical protein CLV24_111115 [Pontibacter ummariensis]SNS69735.1 hypothetical protein SAMN06296052_111115 [Pontibacter ummariensis]
MIRGDILLKVLLLLLLPFAGLGQGRTWEIAVAGGTVHNFRTPLLIEQHYADNIELDAKYRTEPFSPPVYYDVRVSTWQDEKGWELKFTHHKLILDNLPPEVQRFSITEGFNLLTLICAWSFKGFAWSVGGGIVITHPESTIRQQLYPENKGIFNAGYYISGPTLEAAMAKRYYFADRWFILGEGRVTASYVGVPVANGEAKVSNIALHGLLGVGIKIVN